MFHNLLVNHHDDTPGIRSLHDRCVGLVPLTARLEPWMRCVLQGEALHQWLEQYGSPLNLLCTTPLQCNIQELVDAAENHHLDSRIFFARKSNKAICFIDAALSLKCGIDVASECELRQAFDRGAEPTDLICTAAIKNQSLIDHCVRQRIAMTLDNVDELQRYIASAKRMEINALVAIRFSGFLHEGEKLYSRFGVDVSEVACLLALLKDQPIDIQGLHFHLDGNSAEQRVSAIDQSLRIATIFREHGHELRFLDIGGGVPISYLDDGAQYADFWKELRSALRGQRAAITYRGHGLGLTAVNDGIVGVPKNYPYHQSLTRGDWLRHILASPTKLGPSIGKLIAASGLELRMEPGRSALDGCGMTIARVEHRKRHVNGDWLIGVSMNRTQCRTTSDDFLVDPLVIAPPGGEGRGYEDAEITGYLVGAYCTEAELLTLRKLRFPKGVANGDLVVFPNTAGYLMHFLESQSHRIPLAVNLVVTDETITSPVLDLIDQAAF